jgi:hypothetical protein
MRLMRRLSVRRIGERWTGRIFCGWRCLGMSRICVGGFGMLGVGGSGAEVGILEAIVLQITFAIERKMSRKLDRPQAVGV